MGQISLLHLSDIHFSSDEIFKTPSNPREIEFDRWADLTVDEKLDLIQFLIRKIKKSIYRHLEEENFDSVIISGDLCDGGIKREYGACLDYLKLQFQNFTKQIIQENIAITAGNHDLIAEYRYDPTNLSRRFLPFCEILERKGFRPYARGLIDVTLIEQDEGKILLLNVNSCLDFRNLNRLPRSHRVAISAMIRREGDGANLNKYLNIPYIQTRLIDDICQIIQEYPDYFPIIFTHHNLLPIGQFDPDREYPCIVNGGEIIPRLESLNRPILVLYGHIHYCYKEEIGPSGAKIVFSSAPLLFPHIKRYDGEEYGYKIVELIFGDNEEKTPLGCEIYSFVIRGFDIVPGGSKKVMFYDSHSEVALASLTEPERAILKRIARIRKNEYLGDVHKKMIEEGIIDMDFNEFVRAINNLFWRNMIIYNEDPTNQKRSQIRRKIP